MLRTLLMVLCVCIGFSAAYWGTPTASAVPTCGCEESCSAQAMECTAADGGITAYKIVVNGDQLDTDSDEQSPGYRTSAGEYCATKLGWTDEEPPFDCDCTGTPLAPEGKGGLMTSQCD